MTTIAIVGAAGRMGQALVRCAPRVKELQIVAAVDRADHPQTGQDVGLLAGAGEKGLRLSGDLRAAAVAAEVLIDFSAHQAVPATAELAAALGKAVVIGTTGLTDAEGAAVRAPAARIPIVWSPNMSLGVNVLFALVRKAAAALGLDYDVEIVEAHHHYKKDAPSGTALGLATEAAAGRGQTLRDVASYGRQGLVGERRRGEIGLHAVRAGDIVGDHTVYFATEGERLELTHRASSRDCFAMGALQAAAWVKGRGAGLYTMKDVLGL
jgi:4-hydroxy-tetrahydrodipicolinate reductase